LEKIGTELLFFSVLSCTYVILIICTVIENPIVVLEHRSCHTQVWSWGL